MTAAKRTGACTVAAALAAALCAQEPPPATGFLAATIEVDHIDCRYVVYVPRDYDPARKWPLLVFLNGAGECGTDGWLQLAAGLAPAILQDAARWPFVVLFPQKPSRASQWEDNEAMVLAQLAAVRARYATDERRTYLTGLSQGGHGTWVLGARHPELWAAIVPICGYGDAKAIGPGLANMPIWAFHGEDDRAVPVRQSKDLCAAVAAVGGHPELTLYPKTGHDSWTQAYREPALVPWLLAEPAVRPFVRALDDLGGCEAGKVVLRRDWFTDAVATPGAAFKGTTTVTLEFDAKGASWSVVDLASTQRRAALVGGAANEFLRGWLRQVSSARVLEIPETVTPAPPAGVAVTGERYTIDLEFTRRGQRLALHRELPYPARWDARYRDHFTALSACVDAITALK